MEKIIETLDVLEAEYEDVAIALDEILDSDEYNPYVNKNIENIKAYFQSIIRDKWISNEEIYDATNEYIFNKLLDGFEKIQLDSFFDVVSFNKWKKYISWEYQEILISCVNNNSRIELWNINTEEIDKLIVLEKWLELFWNWWNLQLDLISINDKNDVELNSYITFIEQSIMNDSNKDALVKYYSNKEGVLLIRWKKIEILFAENKHNKIDQNKLWESYMDDHIDYTFIENIDKNFIDLCFNILNESKLNKEKNIEVLYNYLIEPDKYQYIEFCNSEWIYRINSLDHFGVMFKELYNFLKDQDDLVIKIW